MGKVKVSIADTFYDRCCMEYTLKAKSAGAHAQGKLAGRNTRISSYLIEGMGRVTLIRCESLFKKNESCVFTPTVKDAPLLLMDHEHKLGSDTLSINVVKTQIDELYYRQFSNLEDSYGKLANAEAPDAWYNPMLVKGSVAKKGSLAELAGLAEDYLDAYLRVVSFAEGCEASAKAEKTKEFSHGLLEKGGLAADEVKKALGPEKAAALFDEVVFPLA